MKNTLLPIKHRSRDDFLTQHSNVLVASLVTVLLVSCSGQVVEEQARRETANQNPPLPGEAEVRRNPQQTPAVDDNGQLVDAGATNGREPPPTRSSDVLTEQVFREISGIQEPMSPQPANASNDSVEEVVVTGSYIRRDGLAQAASVTQASSIEALQRVIEQDRASRPSSYEAKVADFSVHTGPHVDRENYLDVADNSVKLVSESPVSTFSIDVDTAGYSNVRRMIMQEGRLPPHDAVRLEEMINYFSYDYPVPDSIEEPLSIHTELAASPWNPANQLLMVGIQGYEPALDRRPAANLVFLVDVSGSMNSPDKLGLVQKSLKLLVDRMNGEDRIALVVYAGAAGMVLDSTSGSDKDKIRHAIDSLRAGGSTNGAAGIQLAYQIAERHMVEDGINRVIIASDGDLNVGMTDIEDLKELIGKKRTKGIALTTLGFGTGNYNYSLMEQIADVGNGNAAYIDSLSEARKVLVEEMQSTLLTIAKDVKIQIEFNPHRVTEYRLLGYENRLLNREDFINDKVDAGEIGAGHTVTALYEITLTDSTAGLYPDSRYNANARSAGQSDELSNELAFVKVRHKPADGDVSTEAGLAVTLNDSIAATATSESFRFAAAVAGFGQLLKGGRYTHEWGFDDALELARNARGDDPNGYRSELVRLVEMAKLL